MSRAALEWMQKELASYEEQGRLRTLAECEPLETGWLRRNGVRMLNLASNDYLSLGSEGDDLHEPEQSAASDGRETERARRSTGSTASRLIVGNHPEYTAFEEEFAAYKGTESCLLFGSGYLANVGVIPALVGRHDVVFGDRLNHASLVDGIVLSRAEHKRYRHRDLDQLETMLRSTPAGRKKLIVTDSIFSMDGTVAPLCELVWLKDRYGAMLLVDEAHSGGLYGEEGQGLVHALGLSGQVEVQMGTFSKAYGVYGAYVAGEHLLKSYLVNAARSFIYTTALPPDLVATIRRQWRRVRQESWRRRVLQEKAAMFRSILRQHGLDTGQSECHIVPVIIGGNEETLRMAERLQLAGIAAVAIRPPSVPEGTARIRFTIMAGHRDEDLRWAANQIVKCREQAGGA